MLAKKYVRMAEVGLGILAAMTGLLSPAALTAAGPGRQQATDFLDQIGVRRGICVLVGERTADFAVGVARGSEFVVLVQSNDDADVLKTRQAADAAGLLGTRVYVEKGDWSRLHLADNLANAVVVTGSAGGPNGVPRAELLRVLQPRGRLIVGEEVTTKPVPTGIGEWTHPYHGADNNPLAEDRLARAPYLTQFLATPWYGPMPEVTVSSGGRVFKAFGFLAFKKREWPLVGKLVALDGYNGTQLWQRDLAPGFMIHRNTLVATPDTLYVADNDSCKLIDCASGEFQDEIIVPQGLADGPAWKWMTLQNGVLYALVGESERPHVVHRGTRTETGWPWTTVRSTYDEYKDSWGYGRTLFAMNPRTKEILWTHQEDEKIDSRAVCMAAGRLFLYSHQKFLSAVDAATGKTLWKQTSPEVLAAIGKHNPAETPPLGYWTSAYAKCNDQAVYFAGPQREKLVAVSAETGDMLWSFDGGNFQLVLRDDGLYAMGCTMTSKKFDYLTGTVLAELQCFRGNCTRATGTVDSIFARGHRHTGTLRYDVAKTKPLRLPSMRPACQDGVIAANGLLYWGPWMCDCNHSLVGVISLGPAGDFDFAQKAREQSRLEVTFSKSDSVAALDSSPADWPTYRANNLRTAAAAVSVPESIKPLWNVSLVPHRTASPAVAEETSLGPDSQVPDFEATAPVTSGGLVFVSGSDGIVRAIQAANGKAAWKAYTGGPVRYPPTVWNGRVYVGSGDGWVYCFEAVSGRQHWRFRAAPVERKVPVYGRLMSTWPVASGVMVEDGVAYAAAGIVAHDGTYVYALDAVTGQIKWQNNTSANLLGQDEVVGVAVQGHMLMHDGQLYLAGGNVVSPAKYDAATGECLNKLDQQPNQSLDDHWQMQRAGRGSELFLVENQVVVADTMLYAPREKGPPSRYFAKYLLQASSGGVIIQGTDRLMVRVDPQPGPDGKPQVLWKNTDFAETSGVVLSENAVVVIGQMPLGAADGDQEKLQPVLCALDPDDGRVLWSQPLSSPTTKWGIALNRDGRIIVTLTDGTIACFAESGKSVQE